MLEQARLATLKEAEDAKELAKEKAAQAQERANQMLEHDKKMAEERKKMEAEQAEVKRLRDLAIAEAAKQKLAREAAHAKDLAMKA